MWTGDEARRRRPKADPAPEVKESAEAEPQKNLRREADLILPKTPGPVPAKAPVFLFLKLSSVLKVNRQSIPKQETTMIQKGRAQSRAKKQVQLSLNPQPKRSNRATTCLQLPKYVYPWTKTSPTPSLWLRRERAPMPQTRSNKNLQILFLPKPSPGSSK